MGRKKITRDKRIYTGYTIISELQADDTWSYSMTKWETPIDSQGGFCSVDECITAAKKVVDGILQKNGDK